MGNKGFFLTFEGGEGAGKSTQTRLLAQWLQEQGYRVCLTREPGGTPGAELLRELLLFSSANLSCRAEIAVHFAARLDHLEKCILPALRRGEIVLCDRFYDSTRAYQAYGMEGGDSEILEFIDKIHQLFPIEPDLTILLDIPVEEGAKRVEKRKDGINRYEAEKNHFHQRVREGYLALAKKYPSRIKPVDALLPEAEIQGILREKIKFFLDQKAEP